MLRFEHWASCGGWGWSSSQWKFRFDPARPGMRLIGYEAMESARNAPGMGRLSIDLLQGRFWAQRSQEEGASVRQRSEEGRVLTDPALYLNDTLPECIVMDRYLATCK
jgi:hypothetical protein